MLSNTSYDKKNVRLINDNLLILGIGVDARMQAGHSAGSQCPQGFPWAISAVTMVPTGHHILRGSVTVPEPRSFQHLCNISIAIYLTLKELKYFCIHHGDQRVFQFEIIIHVLVPGS